MEIKQRPGVQVVEYQLPMSYKFLESAFYVRDCYPEYYEYITTTLANPRVDYISLTGTPGIGKSILYLYFFQRFRKENPEATIITASFGKNRTLKKCLVFEPNSKNGVKNKEIPDIPESLHLYDGPPVIEPSDNKMVCFTSPNFTWLDGMAKAQNHIELYLPFWSLEELWDANDLLGLGLDNDAVEKRFLTFGGSARYCLSQNQRFYNGGVEELEQKVHSIQSFMAIKECLEMKTDKADICHRIFHYVPVFFKESPCFYNLVFCSNAIARMVDECIIDKSDSKRNELVQWLKGSSKCTTLIGWLFEGYSNKVLSAGGDFTINPLLTSLIQFNLHLDAGDYRPAKTDNCESLDGYYLDGSQKILYLFQMTRNYIHPVKANGIIKLFESMNLNKKPQEIEVRLIFVVPRSMGDYKKQMINMDDVSKGILSDVAKVRGIGPKSLSILAGKGITTVQQLEIGLKKDNSLKRFENNYNLFMKDFNSASDWKFLADIPQYVLELAGDFK
ncbi:hypothetical protein HDV01_003214 [Terramyces sp. JEL0728]|nr:hypothetical protein HDV01_003214 [Terramyces sp. JEL0728]